MPIPRRLALILPLLLATRTARSQAPPPSPERAPLDLAALMARFAAVPERRARFVEEKRIAALTTPLRSTGQLLYRRPAYLEKDTDGPDGERLVVDGDRLVLTEGRDAPRVVDLAAHPEALALVDSIRAPLAGDLAGLQRNFAVTASGTPGDWRILLQPRNPAAASLVARVTVSGRADGPREVLVEQANGDTDRLVIEPLT